MVLTVAAQSAPWRQPLRLAILCHSTLGGSARCAIGLAGSLARRGHAVHLVSRASLPWPIDPAVVHHRLEADQTMDDLSDLQWTDVTRERLVRLLRRVIEENDIEIVHFHYALPFADIAARAVTSAKRRVDVVGTLHGTDVTGPMTETQRRGMADALARASALTTVSRAHAMLARRLLELATEPRVIPNFVDHAAYRPARLSREQHRERLRRPRLIHISNFRAVKSPASLVDIYRRIRARMNAELWLVGDGPELPRVRRLLDGCPTADGVRFFGIKSDVAPLLAHADLLLLTSVEESFGLAALEAMACGVPVLAPRVGGIPELIADGASGKLFESGGGAEAAESALAILSDPDAHWVLREGARVRSHDFPERRIVSEYEALYRSLPVTAAAHHTMRSS